MDDGERLCWKKWEKKLQKTGEMGTYIRGCGARRG